MKNHEGSVLPLFIVLGIILFMALALFGWVDKFLYGLGIDAY